MSLANSSRQWAKTLAQALNICLSAVLSLLAVVVVTAAVGSAVGWWHFEVIESGSMTPALRVGGVAVVEPEPVGAVRVGQILVFHPPGQPGYLRIHRVISLVHHGDQVWARTKGDANKVADPGYVHLLGKTAYVERYFVPYAGYFAVWLHKSATRVALEAVLFVLVVTGGLVLIWGTHGQRGQTGRAVPLDGRPWEAGEPNGGQPPTGT